MGGGVIAVDRRGYHTTSIDDGTAGRWIVRRCVCGKVIDERPLPPDLQRLSGKSSVLVHVETMSTRCFPDSVDFAERHATARLAWTPEGSRET